MKVGTPSKISMFHQQLRWQLLCHLDWSQDEAPYLCGLEDQQSFSCLDTSICRASCSQSREKKESLYHKDSIEVHTPEIQHLLTATFDLSQCSKT